MKDDRRLSSRVFAPDGVLLPIPGSIRWDGIESCGHWGDENNPLEPMIREPDGTLRKATVRERRMIRKLYPRFKRWGL